MRLMRIFARLPPEKRSDLLLAAEALASHDKVWPDTAPTGALKTSFTDFDPGA